MRHATLQRILQTCLSAELPLFVVTVDPGDEAGPRLKPSPPVFHVFWDLDRAISRLYGAADDDQGDGGVIRYRSFTLVLDPGLRVAARLPFSNPDAHAAALAATLRRLPLIDDHAGVPLHAPVLIVPAVFESDFCRELVEQCESRKGTDSGFLIDVDGRTTLVVDHGRKRRLDFSIKDPGLQAALRARLERRLFPAIQRAFQFAATRIERYLICCYDADTGGYFRPHRDDTTVGTAHRRFAVTLNLNHGAYEGGELRFPEFGSRTYAAPTGGAVVFACSLLHEATPVRFGRRFAFLPFLYDEAAHQQWLENREFLSDEVRNRLIEID